MNWQVLQPQDGHIIPNSIQNQTKNIKQHLRNFMFFSKAISTTEVNKFGLF